MPTKLIFFGTPEFAVPALEKLNSKYQISAIVTQPDRPSGRGLELKPSPVKEFAIKYSIKCLQPQSLKSEKNTVELDKIIKEADAVICVAYGNIIPERYLNLFPSGIINIHPSLLPRWRGAAPLQWSIFSGDKTTGVSLMKLDQGLDTGDVFLIKPYQIKKDETLATLHDSLAELGSQILLDSIEDILSGKILAEAQSKDAACYAEKWEKENAKINWNDSSLITERRVRASNPIPGAFCLLDGQIVKIFSALTIGNMGFKSAEPGEIVAINKAELIVSCGESTYLAIKEMQLSGKKRLNVTEILKGKSFAVGQKFE